MVSTYSQVCPVLFGVGSINALGEKAKEFGSKKAICIYDKGVKAAGIADRILKILEDAGIKAEVFEDVSADPTYDMVDTAGKAAKAKNADLIIGIGGGSSIDVAKCVSVLNCNPLPISKYVRGNNGKYEKATPLIIIPTASGTGSEVTAVSVILDPVTHVKEAVFRSADLAIVDPELTLTVPQHVTASTGIDALAHAIESYTNNCGNPRSDLFALEAIRLISANLKIAYNDGSNIEARTKLSFASNIAGISFNDSSVHIGHAAAHEFGASFRIPHGDGCAIALPEVVEFSANPLPDKTINIANALGVDLPAHVTGEQAGKLAADYIRKLIKAVGIRSLYERGISRDEVVGCAKNAMERNWFVVCAPKEVNVGIMAQLLGKMYDNYK